MKPSLLLTVIVFLIFCDVGFGADNSNVIEKDSNKKNGSSDFVVQEKQRFIDANRSLKT